MLSDTTPAVSRRNLIKATGAVVGTGLIAGCLGDNDDTSNGSDGSEPDYSGTIGQVGYDIASIPHTAAVEEMLSEETDGRFEGTIQDFSSGTLQLQALVSGDIQFYTSAAGNPYNAQAAGNNLRIIASKILGTDYLMVVRDQVGDYEDFANSDLSFGISSSGALSHIQPVGIFKQEGVDKEDINFIQIGGSSERTQSVAAGNVDGAALHLGQFQQLQSEGAPVKSLGYVMDYYPDFIQESVVTTAEFIEEHEEFTQEYINVLYQANQRANEDWEWMYQKTQQYQTETIDEDSARETYELNRDELGAWTTDPIDPEGYEGVLTMMDEGGLIDANDIDLDEMIAPRFAEDAADNL